MRTISIVLAVTAVACVAAFPSSFWSVTTYTGSTTCTGTGIAAYYPFDTCIAESSSTASTRYSLNGAGAVVTTRFSTAKDCTGTTSTVNGTFANDACVSSGLFSAKYAVPVSGSFWSRTTYAGSDCSGAVSGGPSFGLIGLCIGSTTSAKYEISGGKLEICQYSSGDCSGSSTTCGSVSQGECLGGSKFEFNSAAGTAPQFVVAAVAILAAVASFRL